MRCQRWVVGVGGGALLYELLATRDSFSHTCESTRALQSQRYDTIHGSVCRAFRCAPASCARLRQRFVTPCDDNVTLVEPRSHCHHRVSQSVESHIIDHTIAVSYITMYTIFITHHTLTSHIIQCHPVWSPNATESLALVVRAVSVHGVVCARAQPPPCSQGELHAI
jgi:hypothetical protein